MFNWQASYADETYRYFRYKTSDFDNVLDVDVDANILKGHKQALLYAKLLNCIQYPRVIELFEVQVNFLLKQKPFVIRLMHRPHYDKFALRIREIYELDDEDFQRPVIYQRSLRQLGKTTSVSVQNYALLLSAPTDDMVELVLLVVAGTKEELSIETMREIKNLLQGSSYCIENFHMKAHVESITLTEKFKKSGMRILRKGVNNPVSITTHLCAYAG